MEEKKKVSSHTICIQDREKGTITGVEDVRSFDEEQIILQTAKGKLTIKGKNLHVSRLHLETGEVELEGLMDAFLYAENHSQAHLLRRLFQ